MASTAFNPADSLRNRRVTVMGLGRFGGGVGVCRWLADNNARVVLTDRDSESALADSLADLREHIDTGRITLRLGGHVRGDFTDADLVIANPAVPQPWNNPYLCAARDAGVPITTEISLLVHRLHRRRVIGITGTAGKSTTAAMIHHALSRLGHRAHLGGNIGGSLLNALSTIADDDWIVLELSSAMLHWLGLLQWSPAIAVITNIAPNHIDWHGSVEHYEQSKLNITRFQRPGESVIHGDQLQRDALPTIHLRIPGRHNVTNAVTAIAAVRAAVDASADAVAVALDDFIGLPHRLQFVTDVSGRRVYNDSKATTPEATVRAVDSFPDPARIHLIVGGYDKGVDLRAIAGLADQLAGLYAIGTTASVITRAAPPHTPVFNCGTLEQAVPAAFNRMLDGDILLLSPGCASWDQFTNFEQRGNAFIELVRQQRNRRAAHARPL